MHVVTTGLKDRSGSDMYQDRCPYRHKWQLVDWAAACFKEDKAKFNKMSKKRLYAIFYSIAKKRGNNE